MANSLSASFPEIWAREQSEVFLKKSVAMVAADTSFESTMNRGDTLHRTYRSVTATDVPDVYTRNTDITIRDVTDTDESLSVNREFAVGIQIDDFDAIQNNYDAAANYGRDYGIVLSTQVDAEVLYEVINANDYVDAGSVGGTAGQGIALTTSNVLKTITAVTKKLQKNNVYSDNKIGIVSPEFEDIVAQYYGDKATSLGDEVSQNGYFTKIGGYKLYSSNNLTGSAVLALATQPTDGDTVTIQGVTFTFKTTLGSTPGNVLIGASADAARANLAALINAPSTTTAQGVALSTANARIFSARVTASNNDTANTMTLYFKGAGVLAVSETLTDGTDTWTSTLIKQHCMFGIANRCTTLVMQRKPMIKVNDIPKQFGKYILNGVLFGIKSFQDNKEQMIRVELNASGF